MLRSILLVLLVTTACTMQATPTALNPNISVPPKPHGAVNVVAFEVPDKQVCSETTGLKDLCVSGMRKALEPAFSRLMKSFFAVGSGGEEYSAEFRFVEFAHTAGGSENTVEVAMRWRFILKDASGKVRIDLAERTTGPEKMTSALGGDKEVTALLNTVLERIGKGIVDAKLNEPMAGVAAETDQASSTSAKTTTLCIPGATQACIGPGACQGGQSCLADGSGFSPCDCGGQPASSATK